MRCSAKVNDMKLGQLLLLLVLVSSNGCSFFVYGIKNTINAPYEAIQECAFRHRLRNVARSALENICAEEGHAYSKPFARGFEDGFVDYIDANGNGEPPAMPPAWLRRGLLRSEGGQSDIQDWFAGFRRGAHFAHENGLREKAIMPIGRPAKSPTEPIPAQVTLAPQEGEPAPPPKQMPPATRFAPLPNNRIAVPAPLPVLDASDARPPVADRPLPVVPVPVSSPQNR
jgi:hypothetical protein